MNDIPESGMGKYQIFVIGIAISLLILDGIDIAVMSYVAPVLSNEWGIDAAMLGLLLSASLFGMAIGSVFLTPVSDYIGRRRLTIVALAIVTAGMILTTTATGTTEMLLYRTITGVGIGGVMANLMVFVSEYSSDRRHGLVLGIASAGYPIGATIGGVLATAMIPALGWRAVFIACTAITIVLFLVAIRFLPESISFLMAKRPNGALAKVNRILERMNRAQLTALPPIDEAAESNRSSILEILSGANRFRTLMLWIGYGCLVAAYYFVNTWTPKIMARVAESDTVGVTVGTIANAGGIVGSFVFAALSIRYLSRKLLVAFLALSATTFVVFGLIFSNISLAMGVAFLLGVLTTAAITGFNATNPSVYGARIRATGMGWMLGIGKLASILAPILVGVLLDGGWRPESVFFLFAIPLSAAALCIVALGVSMKRAVENGPNFSIAVSPAKR